MLQQSNKYFILGIMQRSVAPAGLYGMFALDIVDVYKTVKISY